MEGAGLTLNECTAHVAQDSVDFHTASCCGSMPAGAQDCVEGAGLTLNGSRHNIFASSNTRAGGEKFITGNILDLTMVALPAFASAKNIGA